MNYVRQYSLKIMADIFRCESFTDLSCISDTLAKLTKSPPAASASAEEIMAFVSAVDAACLRLLKSNTEDANKLFLETSRMELEFFTSVDASVLAPLSQELYSFYSQVPATVPATHRPHSQSLSAGTATSLMKKINHVVGSRKDDVTEPLLHTLAGCVLLAARRHPASLQNVFRLLFGLHRNPKLISCACGDAMTCRLRPQIEGIFGDCLEVMGMEAFLQHVYLNVGARPWREA